MRSIKYGQMPRGYEISDLPKAYEDQADANITTFSITNHKNLSNRLSLKS